MANMLWTQFEAVAKSRRSAVAVLQGERHLSFAELHEQALALAEGLAAQDLKPGERALICAANSADLLIWVAALWHRGAIPVLAHADASASHLAHFIATTTPRIIVADRDADWPEQPPRHAPMDHTTLARPPKQTPAQREGSEAGSIVFTSGSSGLPKGVMQAGSTLVSGSARVGAALGYRADDRILCPVPFAFDYGWGQALSCLLQGQTLVLQARAGGFGLCDALTRHAPTVLAGVPAVFADLTAGLAPIRTIERGSVRLLTNTGSKIPLQVFESLCELFPDAEISLNYGLTETYRSATLPTSLARAHPDAVGHAISGVDLVILGEDGQPAPLGVQGEIIHRGAGVFLGYWGAPEQTAAVLRPDPTGGANPVVFTGDLGVIGQDGLLRLLGRRDRQMKSMGVRVSPDEVEAILHASGLVADLGVVALSDEMLGHLITACVVPHASCTDTKALQRSLTIFARDNMSQYMRPRRWEIFGALPRTRSAKVDYPALLREVETRR